MICYYHIADLDGLACGAIFKKRFPDAKIIGYDYGQPFEIPQGEDIIMADVSLPMETMRKVAERNNSFAWVDHHRSAINDFEAAGLQDYIVAVLKEGTAACVLLWQFLFPEQEIPQAIKLLGQYDVWNKEGQFDWEGDVLPFQMGMRNECTSVDTFDQALLNTYDPMSPMRVSDIIDAGRIIISYQRKQDERACYGAFEGMFKQYRAIFLNTNRFSSLVFDSKFDRDRHDIMVAFAWQKNRWKFSLYSESPEIDCGAIAKEFGGGGHPGAAGFHVQDINSILTLSEE